MHTRTHKGGAHTQRARGLGRGGERSRGTGEGARSPVCTTQVLSAAVKGVPTLRVTDRGKATQTDATDALPNTSRKDEKAPQRHAWRQGKAQHDRPKARNCKAQAASEPTTPRGHPPTAEWGHRQRYSAGDKRARSGGPGSKCRGGGGGGGRRKGALRAQKGDGQRARAPLGERRLTWAAATLPAQPTQHGDLIWQEALRRQMTRPAELKAPTAERFATLLYPIKPPAQAHCY